MVTSPLNSEVLLASHEPVLKTAGIIDELKHSVFSFYDTLLALLLLALVVGVLFLTLVLVWLWLALSWLLKK